MNICTNPDTIQEIEQTECIGLSLSKFNGNFSSLEDGCCENSDYLETMYSTYESLSSQIKTLSSYLPYFSRANFYYYISGDDQGAVFSGSFLKGFSQNGTGVFTLSFLQPFADINYSIIGTAVTGSRTETPSALIVTPVFFNTERVIINIGRLNRNTTILTNPDYFTVAVYY